MKEFVRKLNNFFVSVILIFFYFLVIGFAFILKKLFSLKKERGVPSTYWVDPQESDLNPKNFGSAY